jgi:hypothetical protein
MSDRDAAVGHPTTCWCHGTGWRDDLGVRCNLPVAVETGELTDEDVELTEGERTELIDAAITSKEQLDGGTHLFAAVKRILAARRAPASVAGRGDADVEAVLADVLPEAGFPDLLAEVAAALAPLLAARERAANPILADALRYYAERRPMNNPKGWDHVVRQVEQGIAANLWPTATDEHVEEARAVLRAASYVQGYEDGLMDPGSEWMKDNAARERAAKAEAWDEAVRECHDLGWLHDWARSDAIARNPYADQPAEGGGERG